MSTRYKKRVSFSVDTEEEAQKIREAAASIGAGRQHKYVKEVRMIGFRVSKEQREEIEAESKRLKISLGEALRRRCFPDAAA